MIERIPTESPRGWARIETEYDIAEAAAVLPHPVLVDVFNQWSALRRDGEPPSRDDIDTLILAPGVFPQTMLVEGVERNGVRDLRYRLIGGRLAHAFGGDVTGRYIRDVFSDPAYGGELVANGYLAIDRREPVVSTGRFHFAVRSEPPVTTHRLALPLRKLPSGTPVLLVCQLVLPGDAPVARTAQEAVAYEPVATFALVDRRVKERARHDRN